MKSLVLRYSLMVLCIVLAMQFIVHPVVEKLGFGLIRDQVETYFQNLKTFMLHCQTRDAVFNIGV